METAVENIYLYYKPTGTMKPTHNGPATRRDISVFIPSLAVQSNQVVGKALDVSNTIAQDCLKRVDVSETIFIEDKPSRLYTFYFNHDKELNKKQMKDFTSAMNDFFTSYGYVIR